MPLLKDLGRLLLAVSAAWLAAGIALLFIEYVGMWAVLRYAPAHDPFFIFKSALGQLATAVLYAALLGLVGSSDGCLLAALRRWPRCGAT